MSYRERMNKLADQWVDHLYNYAVAIETRKIAIATTPWIPVPWYSVLWLNIRYYALTIVILTSR